MDKRAWMGLAVAAALVLPASDLIASDRVTVMTRTGERVTGNLEDLVNGVVYVRTGQDSQRKIPFDSVALIDFAGEATGLPDEEVREAGGGEHLLVLRNGQRLKGVFQDIEGGEGSERGDQPRIVYFRDAGGERREMPPAEVSRVYLGNFSRGGGTSSGNGGSVTAPAQIGLAVPANQPWTSTGRYVRQGQIVRFQSSGEIQLSADGSDIAAPAGSKKGRKSPGAPLPNDLAGALIGRIGESGQPFGIGNLPSVRMPATGLLFLGINDDDVRDNQAEFRVELSGASLRPIR
jgi:hypothetical protein